MQSLLLFSSSFFFNATPTTHIYTLSLHDALPISPAIATQAIAGNARRATPLALAIIADRERRAARRLAEDRKSTRLNSSHLGISYAVFCLKKKKNKKQNTNDNEQEDTMRDKELQR